MKSALPCIAWAGFFGCAGLPIFGLAQDKSRDLIKPVERIITIQSVAFSPNGKLLAAAKSGDNGGIVVWDMQTLKVHAAIEAAKGVPRIAFSPDGKILAAASTSEHCHLYDADTAKLVRTLSANSDSARHLAFAGDAKALAIGSSTDGSIRIWNFQTGELLKTLNGHTKGILDLAFSSDGKILASSGSDNKVVLWDADSGKQLRTVEPFRASLTRRIALDPHGKWLAGTSNSRSIKVVSLEDHKVLVDFNNDGGASDWLAVSPSGKILAVCRLGAKSVQIQFLDFHAVTSEEQKRIQELIAKWEDDSYQVRESASQELRKIGRVAEPFLLKAIKDSPSAELQMRAQAARQAIRFPKADAVLRGHIEPVLCGAFSPDGELLATGSQDGLVILWKTDDFQIKTKLSWPEKGP